LAEALNAGEDVVSGLGPDEGFRAGVGLVNVGLNGSFKRMGAAKSTSLQASSG
jgi:hypothetical protein